MSSGLKATHKVLLCGYYGESNLGDDALLQVLLETCPADWQPVITASDVASVKAMASHADVVDRRSIVSVLASVGQVQAVDSLTDFFHRQEHVFQRCSVNIDASSQI